MKISAFTFLKNGSLLGYPFIQSIQSVLPIVDEFVVALGPSVDDTEAQLLALNEPKLRVIKTQWCDLMREKGYVYGQQKMVAQFNCTGDWAFYIEADEVVHENDLETIKAACETHLNNPNVEALVFDYLHFYGNKNTYLHSPGWYKRAPRIIKTNVRSYAPDGLFWLVLEKNKVGRYPKAALIGARMYHYGWVRSEAQMNAKSSNVNQYWDKKPEQFDYTQIDASILREFTQTHPKVMHDWLPEATGIFQANPEHRLTRKEKRHRLKAKLEQIFHVDLSKKHFRLIDPKKMSKIFIELPTWLGDGVMATPAIENLLRIYPDAQLTVFGSFVATELFKHHPKIERIIVDTSKQSSNRLIHLYKTARALGKFDLALSFRSSFASKWLLFCLSAHKKALYGRTRDNCENGIHQVIRYNDFVNCALGQNLEPADLTLFTKPLSPSTHRKPLLGLNPGSTYGSAKRWYPNEFAQVAIVLSQNFDIVILGGPKEKDIAHDIEQLLIEQNVVNIINRAGTMSIEQLIEQIAQLDILLTNDSGPMHVAAAFKIKTVAIFGPTNHIETHQWHNPNEFILRKPTECAPCMQRECPLKHHRCMKEIHAEDVLLALANKGWI